MRYFFVGILFFALGQNVDAASLEKPVAPYLEVQVQNLKQTLEKIQQASLLVTTSTTTPQLGSLVLYVKADARASSTKTREAALAECKMYARSLPSSERTSVWCTWNTTVIFGTPVRTSRIDASAVLASSTGTYANFEASFEVSPEFDDMYVKLNAARGAGTLSGASYVIEDAAGTVVKTGVAAATLDSSVDDYFGSYFRVDQATTEQFTVWVAYDPSVSGTYRMRVHSINWSSAPEDPIARSLLKPTAEFSTPYIYIP